MGVLSWLFGKREMEACGCCPVPVFSPRLPPCDRMKQIIHDSYTADGVESPYIVQPDGKLVDRPRRYVQDTTNRNVIDCTSPIIWDASCPYADSTADAGGCDGGGDGGGGGE